MHSNEHLGHFVGGFMRSLGPSCLPLAAIISASTFGHWGISPLEIYCLFPAAGAGAFLRAPRLYFSLLIPNQEFCHISNVILVETMLLFVPWKGNEGYFGLGYFSYSPAESFASFMLLAFYLNFFTVRNLYDTLFILNSIGAQVQRQS